MLELGGRRISANVDPPIPIDYLICAEGSLAAVTRDSILEYVPKGAGFKYVQSSWVHQCRIAGGLSCRTSAAFIILTCLVRQTPSGELRTPLS